MIFDLFLIKSKIWVMVYVEAEDILYLFIQGVGRQSA